MSYTKICYFYSYGPLRGYKLKSKLSYFQALFKGEQNSNKNTFRSREVIGRVDKFIAQ